MDKTPGQVAKDYFVGQNGLKNIFAEQLWDELTVAVIAHARPQIESAARAAAVADVAEAMKKGVHASVYHAVLTIADAPAGFVCVPVEPNEQQRAAGRAASMLHGANSYEIYMAMVAAARPK